MRRLLAALAAVFTLGMGLVPAAPPAHAATSTAARRLNTAIMSALRGSTARSTSAYVLVDGLGTVAAVNADAPVPPASNEKIYTGLAALMQAGPNRRLRTTVRHTGTLAAGQLRGHLVVAAAGDAALNRTHLDAMARSIRGAGITLITGHLFVDESRYDTLRRAPGWDSDFVPNELGPMSAFAVGRNSWRRDASYVANPALYNLELFRAALTVAGVRVLGSSYVGVPREPLAAWSPLAVHDSPQTAWFVAKMLKDSDNFYAEMTLKEIGALASKGTTKAGAAAVVQRMQSLGVTPPRFVDGSGLSAYDLHSAVDAVTLLRRAQSTSVGRQFKESLAIACRDGTLRKRFCGTPASGRVSAKTGTLTGVRTLSGYTVTRSNRKVWFSFNLSGASNGTEARAAIDRAVVAIASFTG